MSKLQITTPKGELMWATLNGEGKTNLNGRQIYTIDVVASAEDAQPLIAKLDEFWEENKPKGSKAPKTTGYYLMDDGRVKFVLKTATTYPSGDKKEIKIYDAKAQLVRLEDKIGNGSTGRASGMAAIYNENPATRGVTLYLDAVQVINLQRYVGAASDFAPDDEGSFDGAEANDGFVSEELV